jgi:hypothetical protein
VDVLRFKVSSLIFRFILKTLNVFTRFSEILMVRPVYFYFPCEINTICYAKNTFVSSSRNFLLVESKDERFEAKRHIMRMMIERDVNVMM